MRPSTVPSSCRQAGKGRRVGRVWMGGEEWRNLLDYCVTKLCCRRREIYSHHTGITSGKMIVRLAEGKKLEKSRPFTSFPPSSSASPPRLSRPSSHLPALLLCSLHTRTSSSIPPPPYIYPIFPYYPVFIYSSTAPTFRAHSSLSSALNQLAIPPDHQFQQSYSPAAQATFSGIGDSSPLQQCKNTQTR
ncbi:hypothetical protein B9Z19DRAFT_756629 [Tuber borchii]|uniref:Uncharacterized protein n=1 Tax=Tuber borchii TaxID=42251 RepID=A0A2T6ZXI7_TUBBO|nr:hypothetical protein B9Z19DRAFT_756629 [Tuber borchii]